MIFKGKKVKKAWQDVICLLSFYPYTFLLFYLSKYLSTSA